MTMSPTAVRTARRNLVQRIDRFVRRIQTRAFSRALMQLRTSRSPSKCLERADYPGGEDAMMCGEYGFAPRFPRPPEPPPVGELIQRFKRLRVEE